MEPTGFFTIHISASEDKQEPKVEAPASDGELGAAGAAEGGYSVRLGWKQGQPYLTDLGSSGQVLVNATPVEPDEPIIIQAGDSIILGKVHLTWNAGTGDSQPIQGAEGTEAAKVTVVLPRDPVEPLEPGIASLTEAGDGPAATGAADPTMIVPKEIAEQIRAASRDSALLAPERAEKLTAPKAPDPTLLAPKKAAKPALPEAPPDKSEIPGEAATSLDGATTYKTVWIDMAQILEEDTDLDFESTTILRDTRIPHLVVHTPSRTWEAQFAKESMTIGRGETNDVSIADESVSLYHALIEVRGEDYVIRDAGSRNGVWLGKQRIEEHRLQEGDIISLGRAKLVFKSGFTSDELTLIGTPRIDGRPARRPVVFVPGLMGTELWIGSERLWPDPRTIISRVEVFRLPGDPRVEARGIVNDVVIVPNIIEQRQYSALGDYLVAGLGYTRGKDLLEFGYDWRQDVRLAAQRLAEAIERWQVQAPITIIAHSLGTLVTRYYVERIGGKRCVERIILMGGPHYGTPASIASILSGPSLLPFGVGAERMRQVLATFPSAYQILPSYACAVDQTGKHIDVLEDESWLPEQQRAFLRIARSFRREIGTTSSVPTVSVFGYGLKTKLRVKIDRGPDGQWQNVEFVEDRAGDRSVPSGSAVLKGSEIHPVLQEHGSLYVDDDVRMRLKVELTRSTTWQGGK